MKQKYLIFLLPLLFFLNGCEKAKEFWIGQGLEVAMTVLSSAQPQLPDPEEQKQQEENSPAFPVTAQDKPYANSIQQVTPTANVSATGRQPAARQAPRPQGQTRQVQFMEISLEDEPPQYTGKASLKEQKAMRKSIDFIKSTNQEAVGDVQRLMGDSARNEVLSLNTQTEKKLISASKRATSLQQFQKLQASILQQHKNEFHKILEKYQKNIGQVH